LAAEVHKRAPEHGGIGHNGPPADEATLTHDDLVLLAQTTEAAKLAVLSKNGSGIQAAVDVLSPLVKKLGNAILDQVNNMVTKFTSTVGFGGAVLMIGWIGGEIGFWDKAQVAAWLLSHLAKGLSGG
jgi:LDH2 family malate/lactate/ureidoglycolate dehydrogenase